MKALTLNTRFQQNTTAIENEFIDSYMAKANGEYVKVYLLLLRHLNGLDTELSVSRMADLLDNTEKDIVRALGYWEKAGLLAMQCDAAGDLCQIILERVPVKNTGSAALEPAASAVLSETPVSAASGPVEPVPARTSDVSAQPSATGMEVSGPSGAGSAEESVPVPKKTSRREDAKAREELKQILFITEQYLGKTLTHPEVDTILYFYETLGFSTDLIEFLIEHCVDNGHKSIHYIRQVALAWYKEKITTVDQARDRTSLHNKNCYAVLKAFGISGRGPGVTELEHIRRWTGEYGFPLDMVVEACNRTMASIHQPSFEYADTILKSWLKKDIRHLSDVEKADLDFQKTKEQKKTKSPAKTQVHQNRFNNFQGRTYDLDSLEQQLLKSR